MKTKIISHVLLLFSIISHAQKSTISGEIKCLKKCFDNYDSAIKTGRNPDY